MRKERKSDNFGGRSTSFVGYQPDKHVPAGTVGKKDGNKTKLS
jgi:hypothetical protein